MRGLIRVALILLLGAAVGWPRSKIVGPTSGDAIPPAVVEDYEHLRVLRLRGTPYEMGYQRGAAERAAIRRWVEEEIYERRILEAGSSHAALTALAHQAAATFPRDVRQELRGIAAGAGLSYGDVLLVNLLLNQLSAREALPTPEFEALAFAAWPPTTDGRAGSEGSLLGYRLDAPGLAPRLHRRLVVVVYQPTGGQTYAALTWSGQVGAWCGLNQAGLALCATPPQIGDGDTDELPPALLTRWLLTRAQDGEQALRWAIDRNYLAAFQLLIVDGRRGRVVAVEFGAHQHRIVEPETGLLVLGEGQAAAASWLTRNAGWLDLDKALSVLASRQASESDDPGLCSESTLLNALLVPGRDRLWIGADPWPASCRRFLRVGPFE